MELEHTADLPPQTPDAADGSLVMQAGMEKGATWKGAEGLLRILKSPSSAEHYVRCWGGWRFGIGRGGTGVVCSSARCCVVR